MNIRAQNSKPAATYADLCAAPEHMVAEIINGELVTQPRPTVRHGTATIALGADLYGPFHRGRGGPGGWIFVVEPELHFDDDVVVPDLAGWRTSRMPYVPDEAFLTLPPDWVCETISPRTAKFDRGPKRDIYGRVGVPHLWLLDPKTRTLETFVLQSSGKWLVDGFFGPGAEVPAAPFDAITITLDDLFPFPPDDDTAPAGADGDKKTA